MLIFTEKNYRNIISWIFEEFCPNKYFIQNKKSECKEPSFRNLKSVCKKIEQNCEKIGATIFKQ